MAPERWTVHYRGNVQGVGFRWTTTRALEGLPVTGYVENLPDGRVRMVVEGAPASLEEACRRVREALSHHILGEEVEISPARGDFRDFGIRR